MRFSLRLIVLTLLVAALVAPAAQAATVNFTFTDMFDEQNTGKSYADDETTMWALNIDIASTVSSVNVFGARPRRSANEAVGKYRTFTKKGSYTRSYYSNAVQAGNYIYLRGKKDNSSTYGGPLNVFGKFTP